MQESEPIKILSVDDEEDLKLLMNQKFRSKIRKGIYEFHFAHDGLQALAQLEKHSDIDIALCDINMPVMDGLTFLTKINELQNPFLKTIMVSAYGDMDNIRAAMNGGAFDFATKPIDFTDLEQTIEKAIEQIKFIRKAQETHDQLMAIQSDLDTARKIQQSILSTDFDLISEGSCFEIYATMNAAKMVGGDFFDFFVVDDNHLGFLVADVSDKGIPAAIYMAVSHTIIRATALRGLSPAACMNETNNLLGKGNVESMFVTVFYGILDLYSGNVTYSNAGHDPPYIIDGAGKVVMTEPTKDMVVGAIEGISYHENEVQLSKGARLFLFTDGVTEALNPQGELYMASRLEEILSRSQNLSARDLVDKVSANLRQFTSGTGQSDDITMMVVALSP
ncbi:MAG: SpoIIE family protein phosphatase [Chlorobi bacterium]|nr:SpoIIE family protein phosphatase [Chlorobiota bacterium]